ncbi:PAS domain S-box protein, partial [Methanosalsum natronophilum]
VAKIEYNGTMIGDFTIMMGKGTQIQNMDLLDIYSSLIGLSITRIDAENRLAQSNVDYQQLVETSMIGIITCDLEGNIKYLNPRVLEILESPSEEETKKINLLTFEPLVNSGFSTHLKNAIMKREKVGPKEIRYHTFWGKELIAKINILPIFNENKVSGAQILIDEVTDKKQIEDLRRKEILLREIHHRVKNNLQVISSLLNMQARNFNDDAIKNAFLDSQTRVRSMSIAHEKLYGSTNLSSIEIADYIKTLQNHMLQMYRDYETEIEFKNDLDNIYLDIETTVPLGLILSELITNSLKHAFRGRKKGGISIKFKYIDNKYVLEVSDDGVGMSKSDKKDSSGSIGLMVVEMLTRQLNGVLEMNGSDGTSFKLTFNE